MKKSIFWQLFSIINVYTHQSKYATKKSWKYKMDLKTSGKKKHANRFLVQGLLTYIWIENRTCTSNITTFKCNQCSDGSSLLKSYFPHLYPHFFLVSTVTFLYTYLSLLSTEIRWFLFMACKKTLLKHNFSFSETCHDWRLKSHFRKQKQGNLSEEEMATGMAKEGLISSVLEAPHFQDLCLS